MLKFPGKPRSAPPTRVLQPPDNHVRFWHLADILFGVWMSAFKGKADMARTCRYVRKWHLADIVIEGENVRF